MRAVRDSDGQLLQKGEGVPSQGSIAYLNATSLDEIDEDFVQHDERRPGGFEQPTEQVCTGRNLALVVLGNDAVEFPLLPTVKLIRHLAPERPFAGGVEGRPDQTRDLGRGNMRESSTPNNCLNLW